MKIRYTRISKSDGSQNFDLQVDSLLDAGISQDNMYHDKASGIKEKRSGLENCLEALRERDNLIVWKLDRLGRSLKHLINIVKYLISKNIGLK
jgi:DNA invertase Pin-like site-specific DNA recombinase